MKELIRAVDGWEGLTAEQIREALVSADPQRRPTKEAKWSTDQLLDRLDVELAESLVAALRAAGLNASADALTATGLDFGNPKMQRQLDKLGSELPQVFTEEIVADLKSLGVDRRSPWQRAKGDAAEPTVEDVQATLDSIQMLANYRSVHSAHIVPVLDGDDQTTADLAAAFRSAAQALEEI